MINTNSSENKILFKKFDLFNIDLGEKYKILWVNKNNTIHIKGNYENDYFTIEYENAYNLSQIKNLSVFFNQCNSINDCFYKINNINDNNCKVEKNDDQLIFIINIENKEIRFELNYNSKNNKYLLNSLFKIYNEYKNNYFRKEIVFLRNLEFELKTEKLYDEIYQLKNTIREYESKEKKNIEEEKIDLAKIVVEESLESINDSKTNNNNNLINEIKGITGENFIKLKNNHIALFHYGDLIIVDNRLNILLKRNISQSSFHSMTKMQADNCLLGSTWGNRIFIIKLSNNHKNCKIVKVLEGEFDTEPG